MDDMRIATASRRRSSLVAVVLSPPCVPEPAEPRPGRSRPAPAPTATPAPTPAGPTPTPSFVRPTPTPQPTFFVYTVVSGDTPRRDRQAVRDVGRSIAYWNRVAYPSLDPDSGQYRPNYLEVGWMLRLIPNTVVDPEDLPPGRRRRPTRVRGAGGPSDAGESAGYRVPMTPSRVRERRGSS